MLIVTHLYHKKTFEVFFLPGIVAQALQQVRDKLLHLRTDRLMLKLSPVARSRSISIEGNILSIQRSKTTQNFSINWYLKLVSISVRILEILKNHRPPARF